MKIAIRSKEKSFTLLFPNCVIFNRLAVFILCKALKKQIDGVITARELYPLVKMLKRYRGLNLVEVKSAEGDKVFIRL